VSDPNEERLRRLESRLRALKADATSNEDFQHFLYNVAFGLKCHHEEGRDAAHWLQSAKNCPYVKGGNERHAEEVAGVFDELAGLDQPDSEKLSTFLREERKNRLPRRLSSANSSISSKSPIQVDSLEVVEVPDIAFRDAHFSANSSISSKSPIQVDSLEVVEVPDIAFRDAHNRAFNDVGSLSSGDDPLMIDSDTATANSTIHSDD
jgi:hypothetical protein